MRRRQPLRCLLVKLPAARETHKAEDRHKEGFFGELGVSVEAAVGCAGADLQVDLARRYNRDLELLPS